MSASPMDSRRRSENEPGILRYYRTLREHVKLIIACTVLAVAVAAIYTQVATKRYSAEAQMLVSPADAGNTALSTLPVLHGTSDPTRDTLTAAGLVTNPQVAQAVVRALHLNMSADTLLSKVTATPIGQSNLLALQATSDSGAQAERLANAFADQVVATRTANLHAALATAIPGLQAQLQAETPAERASNTTLTAELSQLQALKSSPDPTITVSARAGLPPAPYTPRSKLALVAGLIAGLVLGVGGAFLLDALDPRLRREDQLRHLFNALILAGIPRERPHQRGAGPLLPTDLSFAGHEGYRSLRTFMAARAGNKPQAILLTGSAPGEGKTTTAIGLAGALAQGGASVILIEADLRRPAIGNALQLNVEFGTEHLAQGTAELEQALTPLVLDGAELQVVVVKRPSDYVAERLSFDFSQRLVEHAKELADFVIIDSPPITAVVDALPLAKYVDDVVIVSRLGVSKLAKITELYDMLMNYGAPPLGFVVIGESPIRGSTYYSAVEGRRPDDIRPAAPIGLETAADKRN
jgi:Mrp family chromosome partitioning ATPase/LPS O-antigen subunit length determinant protein (WzzB/FepE family)